MPTKAAPTLGETLWLVITAFVFAVVMGIISWPVSFRMVAGASSAAGPTASASAATGASAAVPPSPTFGISHILPPGSSSTMADASNGTPTITTSIAAPPQLDGVKSSLRDPLADQLPISTPINRDRLASAPGAAQSAPSSSTSPTTHSPGSSRPRQHHQQRRSPTIRADGELTPR